MAADRLSPCAAEVRRHDHDRYLSALFAPPVQREWLFALYAFNLEVAKTAEVVSEPMLGQIRLQWWREAIAGLFDGTPRRHAVIEALGPAVGAGGLDRDRFERMLDARERDLHETPVASMEDLRAYALGTSAALVELAVQALGEAEEASLSAARSIGLAWAWTGLIRAVPFHARLRRCYVPMDLRDAVSLSTDEVFSQRPSEALAQALRPLAAQAHQELAAARALRAEVPRRAFPALCLARLADGHLRRIARAEYDPYSSLVQDPWPGRALALAVNAPFGRY